MTPLRLTTFVAMLFAFPVSADELVDRADANGDGYVSLYELRAAYYADMEFNRRIEQSFADYDTDGDGLISPAERRARAAATAETPPGAGMTATASDATAVTSSAGAAPATAAETASTSAAVTAAATAEEVEPATKTADGALQETRRLSRTESWIQQIDADNSGGASMSELVASGDGGQWFPDSAFTSADKNEDGDLDPGELEVFLQSMERWHRR